MDREKLNMRMEIYAKASFWKIYWMVLEYIDGKTERDMKEILWMVYRMGKVNFF